MEYLSQAILTELPAIICLVVGFVLLVVEMYIPGFGVCGITGTVLLVVGVALYAKSPLEALVLTLILVALLCIALSISIHSISKGRLAKSKLVLNDVSVQSELGEQDLKYFVGREGVVKTVLRPAGMGEFDGVRVNIVSDGEFIKEGARVRIDRVEGNRIVVSEVIIQGKGSRGGENS